MLYGDLNLYELMEVAELDFAHYTYEYGDCSCCFGPRDMSEEYWISYERYEEVIENPKEPISYILFKNASNGSGEVSYDDPIQDGASIGYEFKSDEQKELVMKELQRQLGDGYKVVPPIQENACIVIEKVDKK